MKKLIKIILPKNILYFLIKIFKKIKLIFTSNLDIYKKNEKYFLNKKAIEIGGRTPFFKKKLKKFPIYSVLKSIDNCNFNETNFWSDIKKDSQISFDFDLNGKQIIREASELSGISDSSYEILLSSHVIEHLSNPIKALKEWHRVININGYLVLIVPHKDGTYDNKRPITNFNHLLDDFKFNTPEDDTTHFEEVLELHDLKRDSTVKNYEEHYKRTIDNLNQRIVHHHVFDTFLAIKLVDFVGFEIIDVELDKPYNIIIIAKKIESKYTDNQKYLDLKSLLFQKSIFPSDRKS
jgi:predicted SAM-dependent methyltransferase